LAQLDLNVCPKRETVIDHELLGTSVNPKPTTDTMVPPDEGPNDGTIIVITGTSTYNRAK
jgi:hypothetical protein